jgi:hypothetical protein
MEYSGTRSIMAAKPKALVIGALLLAGILIPVNTWFAARRLAAPPRSGVDDRILAGEAGTLFYFRSASCGDCRAADATLAGALGARPIRKVVILEAGSGEALRILARVEAGLQISLRSISPVWCFEGEVCEGLEAIEEWSLAPAMRDGG